MMMRPVLILSLIAVAVNAFIAPSTSFVRPCSLVALQAEAIDDVILDAGERMSKSVDSVKSNLMTIRTGRASINMLDRVQIEYYGALTPLNQMASISVPSAQSLTIEPYDKTIMGDIERALTESDLGLTPMNDGTVIRLNIPSLTEERRKELMKQCKAIGEDGKVAVRNIRRDCVDSIKKMQKKKEVGEDEAKGGETGVQKETDSNIKEIDKIVSSKEKEVMTV